jgi:23S rRNA pseudouridine1911/1915/1917 synthase
VLKRFEFQISENDHKKRLDEFLFGTFSEIGKRFLRDVLKEEKCEVNGYIANGGIILKQNDFVEIEFDYSAQNKMFPEEIPLDIIFEDSQLIVLNKPAGILIHPTPRNRSGTILNGLMFYLNKESSKFKTQNPKSQTVRPGLVHRLDKQTSGLVVITKNARSLRILNSHFKRKLIEKKYLAVVEGIVKEDSGKIEAPIGRYEELRQWNVKADGKAAETRFWVVERFENKTLLELEPVTGRTNQLRIHCAYIGHPILGDEWHGKLKFPRLCLHAAKLNFWHPGGGERLEFESDLPDEIKTLLNLQN